MADLSLIPTVLAATLVAAPPAALVTRPVHLVTRTTENGVEVSVIGSSSSAVAARYTLEVSSMSRSNRSRQRGSVRLRADVPVTMVTLKLGTDGADWTARLFVEPDGAPSYEELNSST